MQLFGPTVRGSSHYIVSVLLEAGASMHGQVGSEPLDFAVKHHDLSMAIFRAWWRQGHRAEKC